MNSTPRPPRSQAYTIWDFAGYFIMVILVLLMGLTSVHFLIRMATDGGGEEKEPKHAAAAPAAAADASEPAPAQAEGAGEGAAASPLNAATAKAYTTCAACHAPTGLGMPGLPDKPMAPSLHGSEIANGNAERLSVAVLKGILPSGQYLGVMAGQEAIMDDATIANALTHVRNSWGNTAGAITAEEVAAARAKYKDLPPMITREALEKIPAE